MNLHEAISESLVCYILEYKLNRGSGGDAFDEKTKQVIEIKATSNFDSDLTSFSPAEEFDKLIFARLDNQNGFLDVYDLNIDSNTLKEIKVNKTETFKDQQQSGRRPRFSIIKKIIIPKGLKPIARLNLVTHEVIKY